MSQSELRSTPLLALLFALLVALLLTASSCSSVQQEKIVYQNPNIPEHLFENGDIVFRRGRSVSSDLVLLYENSPLYSHIGIIVRQNDSCMVIHAAPDEKDEKGTYDKVIIEPLSVFWQNKRCSKGGVYRTDIEKESLNKIISHATQLALQARPFDHSFDLADTNKLYCTELIYFVFLKEGVDISQGLRSTRSIPFGSTVILPGHILLFPNLKNIYSFSSN